MGVARGHPEVSGLIRTLRQRSLRDRARPFERAIARDEIPQGSDASVLAELMMTPLIARVVHLGMEVDDAFLRILVDTIVAGAKAGTAVRR